MRELDFSDVVGIIAILLTIAACFIVYPLNASPTSMSNTQITGSGSSIIYHGISSTVVSSGNLDGNADTSFNSNYGKRSMLALGYATLDVNDTTYSQYFNAADNSMDAEFSDMALIDESYAMEQQVLGLSDPMMASISDITPSYQYASAGATQSGSAGGRYTSDAIVNDANITVSARAEGNRGGVEFRKYAVAKKSFSGDGSSGINFDKEEKSYASFYGNDTGYDGALDFDWKDHSGAIEPANETPTIIGTETANQTVTIDVNESTESRYMMSNITSE